MEGCPISYWTNQHKSVPFGWTFRLFPIFHYEKQHCNDYSYGQSLRMALFISSKSSPRARSCLRLSIVFPNCPPEHLYLFTLPTAGSKRARFPTSLLTSGLIKHYILYLLNPGSELFFLFLLSWRQQFLAQGTGNSSLWGRLQIGNCCSFPLQWSPKGYGFLGLAEDPSLQITLPLFWVRKTSLGGKKPTS